MGSHRSIVAADKRAVLRIVHDVDAAGIVIDVELQPVVPASQQETALAAWEAARRRHPWIVTEDAARDLDRTKAIALRQLQELLNSADELVLLIKRREPTSADNETEEFRDGYLAAIEELRECAEVERVLAAAIDLRAYVPALHGRIPRHEEKKRVAWWHFNRAG